MNALKITTYSTKHTNNTKIHFQKSENPPKLKFHTFKKKERRNYPGFMLICRAIFIFCIFLYIFVYFVYFLSVDASIGLELERLIDDMFNETAIMR